MTGMCNTTEMPLTQAIFNFSSSGDEVKRFLLFARELFPHEPDIQSDGMKFKTLRNTRSASNFTKVHALLNKEEGVFIK